MIGAWLNGEPVALERDTPVREVVVERAGRVEGVAVAVNDAIVPRSQWADTFVRDGDRIEILVAAQGG